MPQPLHYHHSILYLYKLDYFKYLIQAESYDICSSVSGLFHFAHLQGPFVLWNVSKFPSFLRLNIISLHAYTTFRLSIHLSRDILVVSTFRLLWIMLLQKWSYKYLFNSLLSNLLSIYPKMEFLEDIEILCLFFEGPAIQWLHHFTFPSAKYERSNFYTSSPTFVIVCLSDSNHPGAC